MPLPASGRAMRLLWIMLAASVLLPTALFAFLSWRDHEAYLERAEERVRQTTEILHEHALKVFETQDLAMDWLENRIQGLDWPEIRRRELELHEVITSIVERYEQIVQIGVMDDRGRLVASTVYPVPPTDLGDRDYTRALIAGFKGTYIGEPIVGRFTAKPQFVTARARRTALGRFDGGMLVSAHQEYFVDFWRTTARAEGSTVTMFRDDGVVLATTGPETGMVERLAPGSPLMTRARQATQGLFVADAAAGAPQSVEGFMRLGHYPVFVAYALSTEAALAPWRQQLVRYGLLTMLVALGLIAMTGLTMRYVMAQERSAAQLADATERLRSEMRSREQAEADMRRSQEDFRYLYLKTPVMLHSIDREGRLINVSDYWLEAMGYAREEVIGRRFSDFMAAPSRSYASEIGRPALIEGGRRSQVPYQLVRKDGSTIEVLVNALAQRDERGEFVRSLSVTFDVTDWKRTEAQLRQAQKMEAIGQLTGGVAHDLNNLLTVVMAGLERAERNPADPTSMRRALETAQRGAERAASLTAQLLAFSRRQPLEPKAVDVGRLLPRMADLLRRTLGEAIEIETVVSGGLWLAFCDPSQLENALVNLALNARDAMPGGGRLTLEAANLHLDDDYAAANPDTIPGRYAMIAVTDTGCGMTGEVIEHAFEPFFTTKPEGRGTGLGLSQVFGFVRQSGGHVKIYSELGHGTSVRLYLPRAQSGVADAEPRAVTDTSPRGSETVLVVEDDADVRAAVVEMVEDLGYIVEQAANPDDAFGILNRLDIDVLFTDVVMPGTMRTTELAERARALRPGIKVLFTSGYSESAIVHQGRLDAGVHLIAKPYKRHQLARRLRLLLDGASGSNDAAAAEEGGDA
ncbi:MAG TPA: ATP-binding protein [Candidatus Sulfotelmatobacter sp.]|nr:ATP-binding protein [Candidatus Sulfotelmatobacter sp.]